MRTKAQIKEYQKAYRAAHSEELKAYRKAYGKKWYQENKEHVRLRNLEYRQRNREIYRKAHKSRQNKGRYGLTPEEFEKILADQKGLCCICAQPMKPPCVDHDHKTKKIRGLLCRGCNLALGYLQDSTKLLQSAIDYLKNSSKYL